MNAHLLPTLVASLWCAGGTHPVAWGFGQDARRGGLTELGSGVDLLAVLEVFFMWQRSRQRRLCQRDVFGRAQRPLLPLCLSEVLWGLEGWGRELLLLLLAGVFPPGGLREARGTALLGAAPVVLWSAVGVADLAPWLGGGTLRLPPF